MGPFVRQPNIKKLGKYGQFGRFDGRKGVPVGKGDGTQNLGKGGSLCDMGYVVRQAAVGGRYAGQSLWPNSSPYW